MPASQPAGSRRTTLRSPLVASAVVLAVLASSLSATPLLAATHSRGGDTLPSARAAEAPVTSTPAALPMPPGVNGLDISHWNGYPDLQRLRDKGMRFVFSKATQGTTFVDNAYQRHTREARKAGMLVGAYHFFDYNKGGVSQARHFLDTLRSTSGLGGLLPLVVDVETLGSLGTPNKPLARKRLHALMDELYRQTGRYPMIYTNRPNWTKVVGGPTTFGPYPLWVACWSCDQIQLPQGWSNWDFWQFGQSRFFDGRLLDVNTYRRNMDKLRLERQRGVRIDDGAAWSSDRVVQADLRAYDGTHVRVAVDDGTFGAWRPLEALVDVELSGTQGHQDVQLQLRSFRGVTTVALRDHIKLDSVPPKVDGPEVALRRDSRVPRSGARVPTRATMSATDQTSGLDKASLKATCGGVQRAARFSTAGEAAMPFLLDRRGCALTARAGDLVGHRTTKRLAPEVSLTDIRTGNAKIKLSGAWQNLRNGDALGKTLARTATAGARARIIFEGAQVAIVARRGPAGGRFKVIIDGTHVDTIDTYAHDGDSRRIVAVRNVPRGQHVLQLRATGTGNTRSSGTIVWLDAVLALDRRS